MKTMATKILLSAVAATALFTGCGEDDAAASTTASSHTGTTTCKTIASTTYTISSDVNKTFTEECTIKGKFTNDLRLTADKLWALDGQVIIGNDNKDNATVTIDPGTVIMGKDGEFLLISRGSKISAVGTKTHPIIFTADNDVYKADGFNAGTSQQLWGGVAIAGNAPVNKASEVTFEFSDTGDKFGGTNDADNSGVMKYCVVKYSGYEVRPDEEVQGISLGGVGYGTTLEYISIHNSSDDGIEMWGGSVDVKYLSVTGADDDSIDTDNGYVGNLQYVYVEQHAGKGDRLLEADNNGAQYDDERVSHPKIANFTFKANGKRDATNLREGTRYSLVNGTIEFKDHNETHPFAVIQIPDTTSFNVFNGSTPATSSEVNASKFAGVDFFDGDKNRTLSRLDGNTSVSTTLGAYLTANAVTSRTVKGEANATAVSNIGAVIANSGNTDASRFNFDNTAQIGFWGPNMTDWRKGWAVDINGTIIK